MSVPTYVLRWQSLCEKYAAIHPILLWEEVASIIWSESTGNPIAVNPGDPSWGLMQVTRLIAQAFGGFTADTSWHTDPDKNVKCGAGYLAHLKSKYAAKHPDWMDAYNVGEPHFDKGERTPGYVTAFNSHLADLRATGT